MHIKLNVNECALPTSNEDFLFCFIYLFFASFLEIGFQKTLENFSLYFCSSLWVLRVFDGFDFNMILILCRLIMPSIDSMITISFHIFMFCFPAFFTGQPKKFKPSSLLYFLSAVALILWAPSVTWNGPLYFSPPRHGAAPDTLNPWPRRRWGRPAEMSRLVEKMRARQVVMFVFHTRSEHIPRPDRLHVWADNISSVFHALPCKIVYQMNNVTTIVASDKTSGLHRNINVNLKVHVLTQTAIVLSPLILRACCSWSLEWNVVSRVFSVTPEASQELI